MLKIIFSLSALISLAISHNLILDNSEKIASNFASTPYQEISDEEASRQAILEWERRSAPFYELSSNYTPSETDVALHKAVNYREYFSEHVSPIQEHIEAAANLFFPIAYIILSLFVTIVFYRWMRVDGGRIMFVGLKRLGHVSIELLSKLGLKKSFLNYQLKLTEKEFLQAKNLFENGLITEEEFLAKKAGIKNKIRNDNLLSK